MWRSVCSTYPLMRAKVERSCLCPFTRISPSILPEVFLPAMTSINVVLPAPDDPISAVIVPGSKHSDGVAQILQGERDCRRDHGYASQGSEGLLAVLLRVLEHGILLEDGVQGGTAWSLRLLLLLILDDDGKLALQAPEVQAQGVQGLEEHDDAQEVDETQGDPDPVDRDREGLEVHVPQPLVRRGNESVVDAVPARRHELVDRQDAEHPGEREDPVDPHEVVGDASLGHHVAREAHGEGDEADGKALSPGRAARVGSDGLVDGDEGQADQQQRQQEGGKGWIEARVPQLVKDRPLHDGEVDHVHVAHGQHGSEQEQHRDLHPVLGCLPEDCSDDDTLDHPLDHNPANKHPVAEQDAEGAMEASLEQRHVRRPKGSRPGPLVHGVGVLRSPVVHSLVEPRPDVLAEQAAALPPLCHLQGRRRGPLVGGGPVLGHLLCAQSDEVVGQGKGFGLFEPKLLLEVGLGLGDRAMVEQQSAGTEQEDLVEEVNNLRGRLEKGYDGGLVEHMAGVSK
eukprot:767828-Hanusia_phi.AAC.2